MLLHEVAKGEPTEGTKVAINKDFQIVLELAIDTFDEGDPNLLGDQMQGFFVHGTRIQHLFSVLIGQTPGIGVQGASTGP
jgi:hypothetical protein